MSQRQYVSLSSLFQTTIRSIASGTHDVLESIEMEDDVLERRRNLLKLLVSSQTSLQKILLAVQWCRKRSSFYKAAINSEASLISYESAWGMAASQISQHKTAMAYPVWDLHTAVHINSLSGYYLLPQFCKGGVTMPVSEETAKQCRRRLQCKILMSLLSTHPPSHVRIVRCDSGHVTLDSISGYTVDLSLRMAPKNPKELNESEQNRINWTLMSLQFNLTTEDNAHVVWPRQSAYICHNESLRLMTSNSLSAAFHDFIDRVDRICCHARFEIIKRQAQESATQKNRFQASSTELTYWFWPNSALRINLRQPTLRYLIITGDETILIDVPTSTIVSFSSIIDLAIATESARLLSLAEKHSPLFIDVDRNTGKLMVPSSISSDKFVYCNIHELPKILKENDRQLEFYSIVLMIRCSGTDVISTDYSNLSILIRLNGRYLNLHLISAASTDRLELSFTIDGSIVSHQFESDNDVGRCEEVEKFIVQLENMPLPII